MPKIINVAQQSQEWHELRSKKIGASDAAVILGISPFKTRHKLWEQKVGLRPADPDNPAMKRGRDMEEEARLSFCAEIGLDFQPCVMVHDEHDWMMASLDGIMPYHTGILEIKCPGQKAHAEALAGRVPEYYLPQIQHQLMVSEAHCCYYWSYDGQKGVSIPVLPDLEMQAKILKEEKEFFDCVIELRVPGDNIINNLLDQMREMEAKIKFMEESKEMLKQKIFDKLNNHNYQGNGAKVTKVRRQGTIDYSKVPELESVDLEKYRKDWSEYWKISFAGEVGFK